MNLAALTEKVVELEDEMVTRIVERALDLGAAPMEIVNASMTAWTKWDCFTNAGNTASRT